MKRLSLVLFSLFLLFHALASQSEVATSATAEIPVLTVVDSINPGTGNYILHAIEKAGSAKAPYLILQLDTPGGLLTTTRQIVQAMLSSPVPIVVFVGPRGAHAGSASALIPLAADVAVMAPGTNLGAAHPVTPQGDQKSTGDLAAFAESLAKAKNRNTEWAMKAVRDSASILAEQALERGVIDFMAEDLSDLSKKLLGFKLRVAKGEMAVLPESGVRVVAKPPTLLQRLLAFFADARLAYLILALGALCIWTRLTHPGALVLGVVGGVCILFSLIAFQTLPISYGALGLLLLGLALIATELFVPAFGIFGIGGITCFIVGSLFLVNNDAPELALSLQLILPTASLLSIGALALGTLVSRARKLGNSSRRDAVLGGTGEVHETVTETTGKVFVQGEVWNAITTPGSSLVPKSRVVVTEVRGPLLVVVPL